MKLNLPETDGITVNDTSAGYIYQHGENVYLRISGLHQQQLPFILLKSGNTTVAPSEVWLFRNQKVILLGEAEIGVIKN